jgi:tRNA (cytidine/uridine-2'-O-)-methyltransferase
MVAHGPSPARACIRLALYQPDIPQNTGAIIRMAACLDVPVDIIEPAGFPTSDRAFRRAGMDYLDHARLSRHASFDAFRDTILDERRRLVLITTRGDRAYTDWAFDPSDTLLFGRESAGVPDHVHAIADARLVIPMRAGLRSLNLAMAASFVTGEALRQTGAFTPVDRLNPVLEHPR